MLTRLASTIGRVGRSRSRSARTSSDGTRALVQYPGHRRVLPLQLAGDVRQVATPTPGSQPAVSVCESRTGFDWSIRVVSESRFWRASIGSCGRSVDQPPIGPAQARRRRWRPRRSTVLRLSRGIACRPRFVASNTVSISGGTDVRSAGSRRRSSVADHPPLRGSSCDVLLTDGRLAVHLGFEVRRESRRPISATAPPATPVSVRLHAFDPPTSVPR